MQNAGAYFRSWFGRFERLSVRRPDPWLAGPGIVLIVLGLLMVLDTTYFLGQEKLGDSFHYFKLQLAHIGVGLLVCALLSQFSLAGLRRIATPLAIVALVMVLLVWVPGLGVVRGGARRWVRLGPLLAEPSEVLKLTWVFFLATFLAKRQEIIGDFKTGPAPVFVIVALLAVMTLAQPDFGATVMLVLLLFAMLYAAGARAKHLALPGGGALALLTLLAVAKPYRLRRLAGFVDPWRTARGAGFQLIQSVIALGAGGGWGQGLGVGHQKMFFLPQAHTDFVFAVVAEDFGIAGAVVVFVLFVLILVRGMRIARAEPDPFASLLAVGLTLLLTLQALINLAVVIGIVPTKGLPLPFLSYGGTSMVMMLAALGALLALSRRPAVQ
jgi:cell division protein FtsW